MWTAGPRAVDWRGMGADAPATTWGEAMLMNVTGLVQDERSDLAAFLGTLTPQQWEAASLCHGWRVRDVVAHLVSYEGTRCTAGFGGRIALVDGLIHHQDIRRPLGMPRDVPAERLRAALPFALLAPPIGALWHVRGVKVIATDVDWSGGVGPEARGTGEAVLMVMGGRCGVARELTGPGADALVRRLG